MQDAGLEDGQAVQARRVGFEQHVSEALRPLFDGRADEPPTNPEELLRLEQGFREVLQRGQDHQAASSFFSNPGMPDGRDDLNRSVSEAFASSGTPEFGPPPPVLAASRQQIRPSPDELDHATTCHPSE
ncbi:hypothetical protein X758_33320 [Mesorhizobium sp. LSHC416B00]|nr:hypothetical protein X758_33320 [Mesorhizobium sp. LSHC416B00]